MNNKYVIALSFANYLKDKTGIPKVMMAHQQMYNQNQISYVALFSVKKNILNDRVMLFCKFGLIIDGEFKGIFQMSQLIHMFFQWQYSEKRLIDIHIHHLMYINVDLVNELLSASPETPVKVYLHDYYNACTGYTLLKNRDTFCGGNGFSKECCDGCIYDKKNVIVQKKIHDLFASNIRRIVFISPSITTKNIYANFHPEYEKNIVVIPHQKYKGKYTDNLEKIEQKEKIRAAFLGMPMKHKGWNVWKQLVDSTDEKKYEFIVFNSSDDLYSKMKKVKVGFSKDNLNAMTDILRKYKIHIVILWAIWPETYSYTCFEAFSANAFIITNSNSGNIADVIRTNGNGVILSNEKELKNFFRDTDKLRAAVNTYRMSTSGGPKELYENDEIVRMTLQNERINEIKKIRKLVNYPLLWGLNYIYRN